jgi:hypothetical protein
MFHLGENFKRCKIECKCGREVEGREKEREKPFKKSLLSRHLQPLLAS